MLGGINMGHIYSNLMCSRREKLIPKWTRDASDSLPLVHVVTSHHENENGLKNDKLQDDILNKLKKIFGVKKPILTPESGRLNTPYRLREKNAVYFFWGHAFPQ